jgi:hypothetical protein
MVDLADDILEFAVNENLIGYSARIIDGTDIGIANNLCNNETQINKWHRANQEQTDLGTL